MKQNLSSTFCKGKVLFTNKFSLSDGQIYKAKFSMSTSGKQIQYSQHPDHTTAIYWSNTSTHAVLSIQQVPDLILDINETIDIKLASNKELESVTLYTSAGIALFAVDNINGEEVVLPKPLPGKYFIEAQFKCSRVIEALDVQ